MFLANPNNPTGSLLPFPEVRRLHAGLPASTLLVLDAAYAEYVIDPDYSPGTELVDAADNVVMARTFSKIYGLAALRVGWAYCSPVVADVLNRIRNPFNVPLPPPCVTRNMWPGCATTRSPSGPGLRAS